MCHHHKTGYWYWSGSSHEFVVPAWKRWLNFSTPGKKFRMGAAHDRRILRCPTQLSHHAFQLVDDAEQNLATYRFVNSDFVKLDKMADPTGKPVSFVAEHKGNHFHYRVTLDPPVPPGGSAVLNCEGTETTLIKPAGEPDTFVYHMKHWPAVDVETRRVEVHRLTPGAELLSKSPPDMIESRQDGRIELRIERLIPAGGNLEVSYRYRLKVGP
jgi:hypothetical protein